MDAAALGALESRLRLFSTSRHRGLMRLLLAAAFAVSLPAAAAGQTVIATSWTDKTLAPDARAELLLAQMTTDEQLVLVKGYYGSAATMGWIKAVPEPYRSQLPGTAGFVPGI